MRDREETTMGSVPGALILGLGAWNRGKCRGGGVVVMVTPIISRTLTFGDLVLRMRDQ